MSKRRFDELTHDEKSELGDEPREVIEASSTPDRVWTVTSEPAIWLSIKKDAEETRVRQKRVMAKRLYYLENFSYFVDFFFLFFLPTNKHRFPFSVEIDATYNEIRSLIYNTNGLFLLNPSTFYENTKKIELHSITECRLCNSLLRLKLNARLTSIGQTISGNGIIDIEVNHPYFPRTNSITNYCVHSLQSIGTSFPDLPTCEMCFCEHCRTIGNPKETTLTLDWYPEERYYGMDGWDFDQVREDIEESTDVAKVSCTIIMGYLIPPHLHEELLKRK
jgi:hypothetical protein